MSPGEALFSLPNIRAQFDDHTSCFVILSRRQSPTCEEPISGRSEADFTCLDDGGEAFPLERFSVLGLTSFLKGRIRPGRELAIMSTSGRLSHQFGKYFRPKLFH